MLIFHIILSSFIGGLLSLDRIFIQTMVSRPVVIGPVVGLVLGDPYTGLIIGALLELFWIDRIPVGIYVPPNDSISAVFATSVAILAGQGLESVNTEMISLSVLLAIPLGIVVKKIDIRMMTSNNLLSDQALEDAKKLEVGAIERKIYFALARALFFYIIILFAVQITVVPLIIWIYPKLPGAFFQMLKIVYYFMPILGIAVALNTIKLRGAIPAFCAIFLVVAAALEYFHVF